MCMCMLAIYLQSAIIRNAAFCDQFLFTCQFAAGLQLPQRNWLFSLRVCVDSLLDWKMTTIHY